MEPVVTPAGTTINNNFYKNLGTSDSAFPSAAPPVASNVTTSPKVIVTAKSATSKMNNLSGNLQNMLTSLNQGPTATPGTGGDTKTPTIDNTNDSYTRMLDTVSANSSAATKALINTIQAQRASQGGTVDAQYQNYKNAIQMLGIQHNEAQFTPDLLNAHVNAAENEHQAKLQSLNTEENKALVDAEKAQGDNDLKTLTTKMAYIKDLRQQKQDYLKNVADQMKYQGEIATNVVTGVYDQLQKLSPNDQEAYIKAVSAKYNLPLETLATALAGVKQDQQKTSLANQKSQLEVDKLKKDLATGDSGKILTPSTINTLKKANPMIDLSYGDTTQEGINAVTAANQIKTGIQAASQNPDLIDDKGFLTAEYVKRALDNLPSGINRSGFLTEIKDKLYLDKFKFAKNYGISETEFNTLKGQ